MRLAHLGLNAVYLRKLVETLADDAKITQRVEGDEDPVKVEGADGSTHVVMPMKV